jgi:hypothetical protein
LTWLRSEPAIRWLDSLEGASSAPILADVERLSSERLSA